MKKVPGFCPYPKSLPEGKVKSFGLTPLAEEITRQPSIESVMWLLVFMLKRFMMKRGKLSRVNYKMKILRRKRAPGSRMELSPIFKKINGSRNGIKGVVMSGQDPTQLSFQLVEKTKEKFRALCDRVHF